MAKPRARKPKWTGKAEIRAEATEAYAEDAINFVIPAVQEAEYAVLVRSDADTPAGTSSHTDPVSAEGAPDHPRRAARVAGGRGLECCHASFPGMREDGTVTDPGPWQPTAARRAWRETAGQHDRVRTRTGLQQKPRCDISFCDVT